MRRPRPQPREFRWRGQRLLDPDPEMSPEEVLAYHAQTYPELTNAVVTAVEEENGTQVHTLEKPQAPAPTGGSASPRTYEVSTSQGKRG